MALDYDYLESITQDKFIPKLVDNIFDSSALLTMLKKDGRIIPGGTDIKQPLRYAKNTSRGWYSGWDVMDVTIPDDLTAAKFDWANAYISVGISGEDERKNNGDAAIIKLLQTRIDGAEMALMDFLADELYTGSDAKGIVGLDTAINTGTYGGIDGSTYTWWQSTVDSTAHTAANMKNSTSTSFIHTLLRTGWAACKHLGKTPNLIVTTQDVFDIYEQTLQVNARYNKSARGQFLADAGFDTLEFRGIPVTVDEKCPTDKMYMLNTEFYSLYIHPQANFKFTGFKVPSNQDGRVGQILFMGQQALSNRRMFYRWSDLNN